MIIQRNIVYKILKIQFINKSYKIKSFKLTNQNIKKLN